ncbi:beta-1,3-galactosyltransferase 1-like [Clytia hemisphaerica]|uniref:Hexosyltransferase n=1 Tax=Clytia hemisphaerica TaxID=252671 RepID=A0A7M5VHH1_9CNID
MFRGQNPLLLIIPVLGVIVLLSLFTFKDSSYVKFTPTNTQSNDLSDVKIIHEEELRHVQELREMVGRIASSLNVSFNHKVAQNKKIDKPNMGNMKTSESFSQRSQQTQIKEPNVRLLNEEDLKPSSSQILFLVFSHIGNYERRTTIRRTWGNPDNFPKQRAMFKNATYKVLFITGFAADKIKKAKEESKKHGDMLITNRTENYFDISRRTQFGIHWTIRNCKFDYFFKTDDDVFVSIPNTYKLFYQDAFAVEHKTSLYAGLMHMRGGPIRDKRSKWYIDKKLWGQTIYAPFATGMAIILSRNVAERIEPYFEWKNVFPLEDVNIGFYVFVAKVPNIGVRPSKGAEFVLDYTVAVCSHYKRETITMHPVKNEACMRKLVQASQQ